MCEMGDVEKFRWARAKREVVVVEDGKNVGVPPQYIVGRSGAVLHLIDQLIAFTSVTAALGLSTPSRARLPSSSTHFPDLKLACIKGPFRSAAP
jgi:hypothetical protein